MIRFNPSVSVQDLTCDWISESSSGTILREETDHVDKSWAKTSWRIGPERSVEASRDAVSLTVNMSA